MDLTTNLLFTVHCQIDVFYMSLCIPFNVPLKVSPGFFHLILIDETILGDIKRRDTRREPVRKGLYKSTIISFYYLCLFDLVT